MISRIAGRTLVQAIRRSVSSAGLLATPLFSFSRKIEKVPSNFSKSLEDEITAEEQNLTDLSEHTSKFTEKGWSITREDVLVELSKTTGNYQVRLLSNIKSPSNFNDNGEEKKGEQESEEESQGEMNEVSICITKKGADKTMTVHAIVTQGFEITSLNFSSSYAEAKKNRMDIFTGATYTGPEMESLSDELFEGIYGFLEQECEVNDELLESLGDYCIDAEQSFYINWLKDLKSLL